MFCRRKIGLDEHRLEILDHLEARAVAARRRTSVNEMVRGFLKDVVSQKNRRLSALERIQPFLDRPSVHLGGSRPSRDELHER